jgi:hypothetical protein
MNAKQEFLVDVVKCKVIGSIIQINGDKFELKPGYSLIDYVNFLDSIDIEYDDGYVFRKYMDIFFVRMVFGLIGMNMMDLSWIKRKYPRLTEFFDESVVLRYERAKKLKNINSNL